METKKLLSGRLLFLIVLVAVLLRVAAAIYLGNEVVELPGTFDQISYHNLALRVLGGHGFTFDRTWWPVTPAGEPTAHWSYLYTFYLVFVYGLLGSKPLIARILQAVIVGVLHPYLAYRLGQITFNRRVGLVAAAIAAVYIYFVYYAASLMTEPFYITGVLATLYLTIRLAEAREGEERRLAVGLGVVLAVTILLRQLFMLVAVPIFLWLWWVRYRRSGRHPWLPTALAGAIVVAAILPFTIYNYTRFDHFVLLNTNAGYAFFWSNHPIYGTQFEPILPPKMGSYEDLIPSELRSLDEAALDQALLGRGLQFVVEDPVRYARLSLSRIPIYFMFWPSAGSSMISNVSRVLSFGLLWPFMLFGLLFSLFRQRLLFHLHSPAFLLVIFAVVYTVLHLLSWALIRYRLPVDAVLLLFAGNAVVILGRWLSNLFSRKQMEARMEVLQ